MHQMSVQKRIAALLLLLVFAVSGLTRADATQAQCNIRNDWGTYTVVRGDTLYRIAQRLNSTVSALIQDNCLRNANLIFVGQQLHVPGGGNRGTPPPPGGSSRQFTTGATFQQYENGFMVWRADKGEIRVYVGALAGDATSIGELTVYSARQYSNLPSQQVTPPPGRIAPILGFGRLWGNVPTVRQRLGWAISTEQSHTMTIQVSNRVVVGFSIPGSRWVSYYQGNQWTVSGFIRPTPPPPLPTPMPTPTGSATDCYTPPYEPDRGIYVGVMTEVVTSATALDNVPPRGTTLATFPIGTQGVVTQGPICFALGIQHGRYWKVRYTTNGIEGWSTEYAVDINGTETTYLKPISAKILKFEAVPNPIPSGGALTVSWQVEGAQYALLTIADAATNQPLSTAQELPASGSTTIQAPSTGTTAVLLSLAAANLTSEYPVKMYARIAESRLTVPIGVHQTNYTTQAAYQPFQNGFMIWLGGNDGIYVFGLASVAIYPPTSVRSLPDNPYTDAPTGFFAPINGFGRVWGNDTNTRKYMGWATTAEQSYEATVNEPGENSISISLPDGRTVYVDHLTWHW